MKQYWGFKLDNGQTRLSPSKHESFQEALNEAFGCFVPCQAKALGTKKSERVKLMNQEDGWFDTEKKSKMK